MNKHKRVACFLTAVLMSVTFLSAFAGCSMKEFFNDNKSAGETAQNLSDDGKITNSEWLSMLNDAFGIQKPEDMDELENAKDWGFVKEGEDVDPNAPISDEFATKTLMRASGFVSKDASDDEIAKAAVEHGIVGPDTDMSDPEDAASAMADASYQWKHKTFEYSEDIQYNDTVHDFSKDLSSKDVSVTANEDRVIMPTEQAKQLAKDDVFILPPDEVNKDGLAMKALNVTDNGDGTSTVVSCIAALEEVYSHVQVSGGFSPDVNDIEALDDKAVITSGSIEDVINSSEEPCYAKPLRSTLDEGEIQNLASLPQFTIQYPIKSKKTGSGSSSKSKELLLYVTFSNIKVNADVDVDFHWFDTPDIDAYMTLDYKETFGVKFNGTSEESQEFNDAYKGVSDEAMAAAMNGELFEGETEIARVPIEICTGLSIDFVVSFVVSANGYVSFEMSYQHTKGFEMHNSKIQTISDVSKGDPSVKISGSVGFLFSFSLNLNFHLVRDSLIKVDLRIGPKFEAKMTIYNDMVCFDGSFYGSLTISLTFHKVIQKLLNDPKLVITVWDSSNSPMKGSFHLELDDGKFRLVDSCTHGQTEMPTTTTDTNTPKIHNGALVLEKSYCSIPVGTSTTLGIKTMPSDLELTDLVWESSDPTKVKVDGSGNVTAVAEGSANITVRSKDKKHSYTCAVTVTAKSTSFTMLDEVPDEMLIAA